VPHADRGMEDQELNRRGELADRLPLHSRSDHYVDVLRRIEGRHFYRTELEDAKRTVRIRLVVDRASPYCRS
jgi:hypothetical protein